MRSSQRQKGELIIETICTYLAEQLKFVRMNGSRNIDNPNGLIVLP